MLRARVNAIVLISLSVCAQIHAYGTPRAATTVEFHFERENCSSGTFTSWADSSTPEALGAAVRDVSTSSCLRQNGLRAIPGVVGQPPLETSAGATSLSDALIGTNGFALEVWAQIDADAWSEVPLTDPSPDDPLEQLQLLVALQSENDDYCTGIYLGREDTYEVVVYGYMLTYFEGEAACLAIAKYGLDADSTIFSQPTQIVLSVRKDVNPDETLSWRQMLFVDTQRILEQLAPDRVAAPFTSGPGSAIFLGTGQSNTPASLFLFAGYNNAIATASVTAQFNAKLPNSSPAPVMDLVPVPEDGWDPAEKSQEEATNASRYFYPYPAEQLYIVDIHWYDYDEDPTSINFPQYAGAPPSTCALASLPTSNDSQLFSLAGELITDADLPIEGCTFRVRPAWNKANFLSELHYLLVDGVTAVTTVNALQLDVYEVLDPPVADDNEGTFQTRIPGCLQVMSHVIDGDVADVTYAIVEPPRNGSLYHCSADGVVDLDSPITTVPQSLGNSFVGYVHEANYIGGVDEMVFSSTRNNVSTTATLSAHIITSLEIASREACGLDPALFGSLDKSLYFFNEEGIDTFGDPGSGSSVTLQANDLANFETSLDIVFTTTDLENVGHIKLNASGATAGEGVRYPMVANGAPATGDFTFSLQFVGAKDFFNFPQHTYYGELIPEIANTTFCLTYIAKSSGNIESAPFTQQFVMQNVNDPPTLSWNVPSNLSVGVSLLGSQKILNVTGFDIADADFDTDLVHVYVFTEDGRIRVSEQFADAWETCAIGACPCTSSAGSDRPAWMCQWQDFGKELDFVATPSRAQEILNTLQFQGFSTNPKAQIQVEIYDGDGSFNQACISWQTLDDSRVVRNDCFVSKQTVYVEVKGSGDDVDNSGNTCKYMCELRLILIALLILLVAGVCSLLNCCRKCALRMWRCCKGKKEDPQKQQQKQKQRDGGAAAGSETVESTSVCVEVCDRSSPSRKTTKNQPKSSSPSSSNSTTSRPSPSPTLALPAATNQLGASDPDLEIWEAYTDAQSRTYYYNPHTRESTWKRPESFSQRNSWQSLTDPEGRAFYFNPSTRQSTWELPASESAV